MNSDLSPPRRLAAVAGSGDGRTEAGAGVAVESAGSDEDDHSEGAVTWQPIATAPKDGRMVLVYPSRCWCDEDDRGEVAYWCPDFQEWVAMGPTARDYDGPTHWMAIPDPPKESVA